VVGTNQQEHSVERTTKVVLFIMEIGKGFVCLPVKRERRFCKRTMKKRKQCAMRYCDWSAIYVTVNVYAMLKP